MGTVGSVRGTLALHTVHFTEIYAPVVNGVVASIDALCGGLRSAGVRTSIVAPHLAGETPDERVLRLPSLPLPTPTPYRLTLPLLEGRRVRDAGIVHAHSPFVTGSMAAALARRRGVPLVFTYHTRFEEYAHYAPFDRAFTRRVLVAVTRRYANRADAVIVPTAAMEQRLREIGVRTRIAVIPSGIDAASFAGGRRDAAFRAGLGAGEDAAVVLAVGRLGIEKDLELVLEALPYAPGMLLALVGDGPHRRDLEAKAASLGLGARVRFLGAVPRAELPRIYASADVFAFPSATDTQGLVLAEAAAAGLPVVARDTAVAREVLGGRGRFLPREAAAFGAALAAAARDGRDQSAAHLALSETTVGVQTRRTLALYEELLAARND